jgi:hypothetical protein
MLSAVPKTAAATARQVSTSNPEYLPVWSTKLKPGIVPSTPQINLPRSLMVARRLPTVVEAAVPSPEGAVVVGAVVLQAAIVKLKAAASKLSLRIDHSSLTKKSFQIYRKAKKY